MNLLVVLDNDGHCLALERTVQNLRKIIHYLDDAGMADAHVPAWVDDPEVALEKLEKFMVDHCPMDRSGGGQLYFVESKPDFKSYNPFQ